MSPVNCAGDYRVNWTRNRHGERGGWAVIGAMAIMAHVHPLALVMENVSCSIICFSRSRKRFHCFRFAYSNLPARLLGSVLTGRAWARFGAGWGGLVPGL